MPRQLQGALLVVAGAAAIARAVASLVRYWSALN